MSRLPRMLVVASLLATGLLLSGCSSFDTSKFDPTDMLDGLFAEQKKPLPGERKELFPQGTPGVEQGVPPELVKGYQPPPDQPPPEDQPPEPAKPKAKDKAKAKSKATTAAAPPPEQQPSPAN
jgi:hypothetical protein